MMINNGAIISLTEKISMIVKETTEDFIIETIEPYCSGVAEIKISKEELKRIILKNYGKQKTGHWIRQDNTKKPLYGWYFCSECNSVIGDKTKFCSNCGAKMESEETE